MSGEQGRRPQGRRDNGLAAATYSSLGDVDPRVGEHLLDVLYLAGIAAYLQPSVDFDAIFRAASLPANPTDRLWVDRRRAVEARGLVETEAATAGRDGSDGEPPADGAGPDSARSPGDQSLSNQPPGGEPSGGVPTGPDSTRPQPAGPDSAPPDPLRTDEEQAWQQIVAWFDHEAAEPVPRWSVLEDAEAPPRNRRRTDPPADDVGARPVQRAPEPLPAEDEEQYVPPPPPPLPRFARATVAAVTIIAAGLVLLARPELLGLTDNLAVALPVAAIAAGFAVLIWRMHDGPPGDDDPDDGAVV